MNQRLCVYWILHPLRCSKSQKFLPASHCRDCIFFWVLTLSRGSTHQQAASICRWRFISKESSKMATFPSLPPMSLSLSSLISNPEKSFKAAAIELPPSLKTGYTKPSESLSWHRKTPNSLLESYETKFFLGSDSPWVIWSQFYLSEEKGSPGGRGPAGRLGAGSANHGEPWRCPVGGFQNPVMAPLELDHGS